MKRIIVCLIVLVGLAYDWGATEDIVITSYTD